MTILVVHKIWFCSFFHFPILFLLCPCTVRFRNFPFSFLLLLLNRTHWVWFRHISFVETVSLLGEFARTTTAAAAVAESLHIRAHTAYHTYTTRIDILVSTRRCPAREWENDDKKKSKQTSKWHRLAYNILFEFDVVVFTQYSLPLHLLPVPRIVFFPPFFFVVVLVCWNTYKWMW